MAGDFKVITLQDSGELQNLQFAEEGTARRKYYEARMKDDPNSLFSSVQGQIEYMLSEPKVLMWTSDWAAAGDERLKGTSTSNVHMFVAILTPSKHKIGILR